MPDSPEDHLGWFLDQAKPESPLHVRRSGHWLSAGQETLRPKTELEELRAEVKMLKEERKRLLSIFSRLGAEVEKAILEAIRG